MLNKIMEFMTSDMVLGGSLIVVGAAVAIEVALQKEIRSIIIESAFTSTKDMARAIWLFRPVSYFLPAHYNNQKKITDQSTQIFFSFKESRS